MTIQYQHLCQGPHRTSRERHTVRLRHSRAFRSGPDNQLGSRTADPRYEVPTLIDGDFKVLDSAVILNCLEDRFPQTPLSHSDAQGRARALMIEEICDAQCEAVNWGYDEVAKLQRASGPLREKPLRRQNDKRSKFRHGSKFNWATNHFPRDTLGYADLCVAPMVHRSVLLGMGPAEGSPLQRWFVRIQERHSVKQTLEEAATGAQQKAKISDFFLRGGSS